MMPGSARHARRYAQEMLNRLQSHPEWGSSCRGFFLADASPLAGPAHIYFIVLPEMCRGHVQVWKWGWGNLPEGAGERARSLKTGIKTVQRKASPSRKRSFLDRKTACGQTKLVKDEVVEAISGQFGGTRATVLRDGPNKVGKVLVQLEIFGRHTKALVHITDLKIVTE
jgi:hypothetical protein